jgi:hypothetical protein
MSFPFLNAPTGSGPLVSVNTAHSQLSAKLSAISTLRSQKTASKVPEEQAALQTLIDLRCTEAQPLITSYVNAVSNFIGTYTTTPSS